MNIVGRNSLNSNELAVIDKLLAAGIETNCEDDGSFEFKLSSILNVKINSTETNIAIWELEVDKKVYLNFITTLGSLTNKLFVTATSNAEPYQWARVLADIEWKNMQDKSINEDSVVLSQFNPFESYGVSGFLLTDSYYSSFFSHFNLSSVDCSRQPLPILYLVPLSEEERDIYIKNGAKELHSHLHDECKDDTDINCENHL